MNASLRLPILLGLLLAGRTSAAVSLEICAGLRPPAVPLVVHDPYFSAWSFDDAPEKEWSGHWTGAVHPLCGLVRVDGKTYVFFGAPKLDAPAATRTGMRMTATRTFYDFEAGGVKLTLTFASPLTFDDLSRLSRPASYCEITVVSADGAEHDVAIHLDATGEWAVDNPKQTVRTEDLSDAAILAPSVGADPAKPLARAGDNRRIEWGRLLLGAKASEAKAYSGDVETARRAFAATGEEPASEKPEIREASDRWPGIALAFPAAKVGAKPIVRTAVVAYFDDVSIRYFGKDLRVWWNKDGAKTPRDLVRETFADRDAALAACETTDAHVAADALRAGGRHYADLCILSYRQAIAAHKAVAAPDGKLLFLSKECFSNGSIGTVDVTYPSFPLFAAYSPELAEGLLNPIFDYCESGRWTKPFPPHDLGTYPLANGQTYPRDMPVEEAGNMVLCAAALPPGERTKA